MFTGIVREIGTVAAVRRGAGSRALTVAAASTAARSAVGDSVSVEGVCLTVTGVEGDRMSFDVGAETLERSTLGELHQGDQVNLEAALRVGDAVGGHFVSGHVDGVGRISRKQDLPGEVRVEVEAPPELTDNMIPKGSVAVDGISLTIAALRPGAFEVSLIPHTLEATTLNEKAVGAPVNIECDMIGRWVRRIVGPDGLESQATGMTLEDLEGQGF